MREPKRIRSWREAALALYFKLSGHRCILCSASVAPRDAVLYECEGEFLLAHRDCLT